MVNADLRKQRSKRASILLDVLMKRKSKRDGTYISLRDIEEATGIGASTLMHWKNQDVTRFDADKLVALCDYFGCRLGDLIKILPPDPL